MNLLNGTEALAKLGKTCPKDKTMVEFIESMGINPVYKRKQGKHIQVLVNESDVDNILQNQGNYNLTLDEVNKKIDLILQILTKG